MFSRIRRFFDLSREADAVADLSERDLADLGVSRDQMLNLMRLPRGVPARAEAMGRIFGRSAPELSRDRPLWWEMLETCQNCRALPYCERFLARQPEGEAARHEASSFCPNRAGFEALPQSA